MTCASLTDILLSHAMRTVDFLSLDIEGSEERALLGLDFSRVRVSVVLMECEFEEALAAIADGGVPNASANSKQRAAAVLIANGFRLVQGLGKGMRYNHKPIDTVWIHQESEWWRSCSWTRNDAEPFGPWTPNCAQMGRGRVGRFS